MKKLSTFLLAAFVAATVFTSCAEETAPVAPVVTVTLKSPIPATYAVGEKLTFSIKAVTTAGALGTATVTPTTVGGTGTDKGTYTYVEALEETFTYSYVIPNVAAGTKITINVTATAVGTDGVASATGDGKIEFNVAAAAFTEFTAKMVGAQDNATYGSFLDAKTGMVYKVAEAILAANQPKIDMIFYYGSTNKATLAAPNDATLNGPNGFSVFKLDQWVAGNKNATKFALSMLNYGTATAAEIKSAANAASGTMIADLLVDKIVVFKTANNKIGLIKVTALSAAADGTMTVSVKVSNEPVM